MDVSLLERERRLASYRDVLSKRHYLLSFSICSTTAVMLSLFFEQLFHWFLIPVVLCGTLIGSDAIEWFRRETDTFDPRAIFGLYGIYFFFIAPILHVILDYWMRYVTPPSDWRPWLGYMALLNLLGLILLVWTRDRVLARSKPTTLKKQWLIDKKRFLPLLVLFLVASFSLQIYVYVSRGGLMGYITAYTERQTDVFQGMGWVFMISESLPILALIGYAVYAKGNKVLSSWPVAVTIMLLFIIIQILFGGLRGSRSNTVFTLIWAVGIIHFWVRPVPKKLILFGLVFLFLFMYFYGFYKGAGLEVTEVFKSREMIPILEKKTGRDVNSLLLGDFSRSDVQAFILYRMSGNSDYKAALGRTYIGALSILIPRQIWPEKPPTKVKEGTEVTYGMGSYSPGKLASSRVYGVSGEAMLNFGPYGVIIVFIVLGFIMRLISKIARLDDMDSRNLLIPILIILPIIILASDLDNIIFFLVKQGFLPFLLILLASLKKVPIQSMMEPS